MASVIQRSFAGGEIAPALYARADQVKYATGLRTCLNFQVMRHGGASNRAGFEYINTTKNQGQRVRLIPFIYNDEQTYVLEFGHIYMRMYREGARVTSAGEHVTNGTFNSDIASWTISVAGPEWYSAGQSMRFGNATTAAGGVYQQITGLTIGQAYALRVTVTDVGGSGSQETGLLAQIGTTSSGSDVLIGTALPPGVNTLSFTPTNATVYLQLQPNFAFPGPTRLYTADDVSVQAVVATPAEIVTPYAELHLQELQYVQSDDVITIVHPEYAPRDLTRTGHAAWSISLITFAPTTSAPTGCSSTVGVAGTGVYKYRVTAVAAETLEESFAGREASKTITGATIANPVVVTSNAHGYQNRDEVYIDGIVGMTQLNGRTFKVNNVAANTYDLIDTDTEANIDGSAYSAYVSGGTSQRTHTRSTNAAAPTLAAPNVVTWTAVAGAAFYNVYREESGVYGWVGSAVGPRFNDTNILPDLSDNPPTARNPFNAADSYPSTVAYTQQRRCFGGTEDEPQKVWMSRIGQPANMTTSFSVQDDDAVTFSLKGRKFNGVRHLFEVDARLIALSTSGSWEIRGDAAGAITPGEPNPRQFGYSGASTVMPVIVDKTAIYVQARGSVIRDLRYEVSTQDGSTVYRGRDLSVFADHLFKGYAITDLAYQEVPDSIVWAVRDDGVLLGMTYMPDHDLWAWHRHSTDGEFENICVVPEGNEDALYAVVKRNIGNVEYRYIERMHSRFITDVAVDAFFVDSGLTYDGRNTGGTSMTLSGGTNWTVDEVLTLTASANYFVAGDVGNDIVLRIGDDELRLNIMNYTGATIVTGQPSKTVPAAFRSVATLDWGKAVDEISNLGHLEGKTIAILGDGSEEPQQTVSAGTVAALSHRYEVIHAGLPITADLETLDLENAGGATITDKKKRINRVTVITQNSTSFKVGPSSDRLKPRPISRDEYDFTDETVVAKSEIVLDSGWEDNGRIFIRQDAPLPLTVLALVPSGIVGG